MVASVNAPNLAGSVHGHFALNEVSSEPSLEKLTCAWTMSASSLLDKVMAKEKTRGEELSALGKQTMAHAYSAMDGYFDHLKKTVASASSGGTDFGEAILWSPITCIARTLHDPQRRENIRFFITSFTELAFLGNKSSIAYTPCVQACARGLNREKRHVS
jgi:hypothetical protein